MNLVGHYFDDNVFIAALFISSWKRFKSGIYTRLYFCSRT